MFFKMKQYNKYLLNQPLSIQHHSFHFATMLDIPILGEGGKIFLWEREGEGWKGIGEVGKDVGVEGDQGEGSREAIRRGAKGTIGGKGVSCITSDSILYIFNIFCRLWYLDEENENIYTTDVILLSGSFHVSKVYGVITLAVLKI